MATGVEPLLLKAAFNGAVRSLGPAGRFIKTRGMIKRTRRALDSNHSPFEAITFIKEIDPDIAAKIQQFCAMPEVEHLAYCVATSILLDKCGRKTDKSLTDLKLQLKKSLELHVHLTATQLQAATDAIFTAISDKVVETLSIAIQDTGELPSEVRAALVTSAGSYALAFERNTKFLQRISTLSTIHEFEEEFCSQIRSLNGSMRMPHAGTTRQVPYNELYVQPNVQVQHGDNPFISLPISALFSDSLRITLLGDPGGGKSTLSLKLAYDVASGDLDELNSTVPFLVILRDYAIEYQKNRLSLIEYIEAVCKNPYAVTAPEGAIEYLLANGRAMVIFDGLDELLDISLRQGIVDSVTGFAYRFPTTPILVTSRRVGYDDAPLDSSLFRIASLQEFSLEQVSEYVDKWFSLDISLPTPRREALATGFKTDSAFVQDLRVNPLMLSLMCGIYATENYIPSNRPDVYEKCALLLFERWDKQRGINAGLSFDAHVQAAMRSLALWLYPQQASQTGLSREKLIDFMKNYLREKRFDNDEDAEIAATQFIDFCKGRAWVLTDVGAELYGFTHRTFLEYFAASQLVRLYPDAQLLYEELKDKIVSGGWNVVVQLSIQILNKTVEDGGDNFLNLLINEVKRSRESRRSRFLAVAVEALEYIVPRASVLRDVVHAGLDYRCKKTFAPRKASVSPDSIINTLLAASKENRPRISKLLFEHLLSVTRRGSGNSEALGLALHLDLHPGVFPSHASLGRIDGQFWASERRNNEQFFQRDARKFQSTPWVGCYLFEKGEIDANDFLRTYGPRVLLTEGCFDPRLHLPLLYRLAFTSCHTERYAKIDRLLTTKVSVAELIDALIKIPTPWFDRRLVRSPRHPAAQLPGVINPKFIVDSCLDPNTVSFEKERLSAIVFLICVLADYPIERERVYRYQRSTVSNSNQMEMDLITTIIDTKAAPEKSQTLQLDALDHLDIQEDIANILQKWISGDLRFWDGMLNDDAVEPTKSP